MVESLAQGIICAMKKHYHELLLNCLAMKHETYKDVAYFMESKTVYDAAHKKWMVLPSTI